MAVVLSKQSAGDTLVSRIEITATFFTTDILGNVYAVSDNVLYKYDAKGELLHSYTKKDFGALVSADASDPMKVLLFFPTYGRIVLLDNQLAEQAIIQLFELNIRQPLLSCTSYHEGFWVLEQATMQLIKFNYRLERVYESENLASQNHLIKAPHQLTESGNWLLLYDTLQGIFAFDKFGTFSATIDEKGFSFLQATDDKIFFLRDSSMVSFDLKTKEKEIIQTGYAREYTAIRREAGRLSLLGKNTIGIFETR